MSGENQRSNFFSKLKFQKEELPFFCRIIQLIFCIISLSLIIGPYNQGIQIQNFNHIGIIVFTSICGYILINSILIICYLIGEKQPKKMDLLFTGIGATLCFISGIIIIYDWDNHESNLITRYMSQYLKQMLTSGIFSILAALIFALNTYFINKYA